MNNSNRYVCIEANKQVENFKLKKKPINSNSDSTVCLDCKTISAELSHLFLSHTRFLITGNQQF